MKSYGIISQNTNENITAKTMVGSRFATFIFLPQIRLSPSQKMSTEPVRERFVRAFSVITGSMNFESRVTEPWKRNTGIAEKIHPLPSEAVMIKRKIISSNALTVRME